ncbi:epithelial sodium channel subunit gamma-like [Porites lutea]|uniref:epithelial sodium channel subunit gamma-like n=1 Tax=Porites lutea TaxID=51062 RepID=UPI003CC51EC3
MSDLSYDEIETTESPSTETPGNDTELDIDPDDELRVDYLFEELLIAKLAVENNTMLSDMGHQFKDFVFDCNFRGNDCRNFSKYWYHFWDFRYGNCYIFNSGINQTIHKTQTTGPFGGLKLNLFIESHEYVSQLSHAEGARIVIHDQAAIPFPDDEGMNVLPGISTSVGIRTEKIQRADPFNNGSCRKISEVESPGDYSLIIFFKFFFCQACMKSCLSTLQIRKCGCADAHSAYDETIAPICDIIQNRKIGLTVINVLIIFSETCLNDLVERFMNGALDCQSECPVLCSEVVFKPTTSMARWPSQGYKQRLFNLLKKRGNDAYADQLSDGADFLEEDFLQVRVFFERLNFQEVREQLSYKDVNLLADIGGQLGLWIGVSVLTCCEFLELALRLTQNLFKRLAAHRNKFKVGGLQK